MTGGSISLKPIREGVPEKKGSHYYSRIFTVNLNSPPEPLATYDHILVDFKEGDIYLLNLDFANLDKVDDGVRWNAGRRVPDIDGHTANYYHQIDGAFIRKIYSRDGLLVIHYATPKRSRRGTQINPPNPVVHEALPVASFADAVVQIYLDNAGDLELVAKTIESANLDFSSHGDTFFEVIFTGGQLPPGKTKSDGALRHSYSVIDCEPKRESILPSVLYLQKILSTRPSLVKNLEHVIQRFLQTLELFEENERKKLAIFTALAFSQKLSGLLPETVFQPLLKDDQIAQGTVLTFITDLFKEYLIDNKIADLISLLEQGKMEDNLQAFFPAAKRSPEDLSAHFIKEGLTGLVEYNEKKIFEVKFKEMKSALSAQIAEKTNITEVIESLSQRVKEAQLPVNEIIEMLWDVVMDAVQWSEEDLQQNANAARIQVKTWAGLLNTFCTSGELELELMYEVQMKCYDNANLRKLFPEIVESLYDQAVLAESTVLEWHARGARLNGRKDFKKALDPFVARLGSC